MDPKETGYGCGKQMESSQDSVQLHCNSASMIGIMG